MSTGMFVVLTGIAFFLMTCLALLDIARKDFGSIQAKGLWALIVALVPFVGVSIYILFGRTQGKQPAAETPTE